MQFNIPTIFIAISLPMLLMVVAMFAERILPASPRPDHPRLQGREFWSAVQPGIFLNMAVGLILGTITVIVPSSIQRAPISDALYLGDAPGGGAGTTDAILATAANALSLSIILTCAVTILARLTCAGAILARLFGARPHRRRLPNHRCFWLEFLPGTILTNCTGGVAFLLLAGTIVLT